LKKQNDDIILNRINLPERGNNILQALFKAPVLAYSLFSLGLALLLSLNWISVDSAQDSSNHIRIVQSVKTNELGINNPVGLPFSLEANAFHMLEIHKPTNPPFDHTDIVDEITIGDLVVASRDHSTFNLEYPKAIMFAPNPDLTDYAGQTTTNTTSTNIVTEPNLAPVVNVGPDQTITLADSVFLEGIVSDDGLPNPPGALTAIWSQQSGPGTVTISNSSEFLTTATFSTTGTYVLRLSVSDGQLNGSDDLTVTVNATPPNTILIPQDYPTIQAGIDASQIGDLVLVSPGTYTENLNVTKTITLASTFYTTGDSSLIDQTIISSTDSSIETIKVSSSTGPETKIIGFKIRDGKEGIKIKGKVKVLYNHLINSETDAVDFSGRAAGLVQDNIIDNNGDDAVDIDDASVLIEGNQMLANGEGVEIRASNHSGPQLTIIIRNNTVENSSKSGLQLIDTDTIAETAALLVIERNLVANNAQSGLSLMDNAVTSDDYRAASLLERIHLFNNTFVGNLYGAHGGDNLIAINNIFLNHPNIAVKQIDGNSLLSHNLFWNNGTDNLGSNLDTGTTLFADPLLDLNYQLQLGSPAIDAGTALFTLPSGETVLNMSPSDYFGTAPDLGAHESNFGSSGNSPPSVDAGDDQTITLPTISVNLAGVVSDDGNPDPPGTTITTWSQVSGTPGVDFENLNALETSATFPEAGIYVLRLSADDSEFTNSDDIVITVNLASTLNQPPIVDAGPDQTITLPASTNLDGTVDDDGLPNPPGVVTIDWLKLSGPGIVTFDDASSIDTSASFSSPGIYILRLMASDSELAAYKDITITVNPEQVSTMHVWLPILLSVTKNP
jgi:hypothetical protein